MAAEDKKNGFSIPEGYFDNLSDNIRTSIFLSELKEKQIDNGFLTPDNYFENLESKLSKITKQHPIATPKKTVKIVSMGFIKYAVAASLLLICAFAIYTYNNTSNSLQNQLAYLPNEAIEVYLQNTTTASDMPLIIENVDNITIEVDNDIDTKALNNYLIETI
jgi:hypothetical protein